SLNRQLDGIQNACICKHCPKIIFFVKLFDIKTVQTNLGHFAPSFTLKTYAHVTDKMQQNSAARMEEMLKNLPSAT
ncbi:MAG TPA: hypothetical protein H9936_00810, partial [Candidatus Agathobaculum intestinigallinarum]|nr:hypothetical protein [Candidatus Agathobaculum intestinigallinarum]